MTRFLSDALQAEEPFFRLGLRRLEAAHGHPNTDIRFSAQVERATRDKIRELGLDPRDTTARELYHALQERVKADDARLTKHLRTIAATHVSAEGEVIPGMVYALKRLPDSPRQCFALKNASLRALFKKLPPRKAMKRLGYRSIDSFLKHEAPVSVLAAAWLTEGEAWRHKLLDSYKKLGPGDFENREISVITPDSARWRQLADSTVAERRHNILGFREAGTLVLLPLPAEAPAGTVTASLGLALHELNQIRAGSTFLKLCQVRPDFGKLVSMVAAGEPHLAMQSIEQPVPWQLLQRYYARLTERFRGEIFEPHVRLEDMAWHSVEHALSAIDPGFGFWKGGSHLGMLHGGRAVSLNVVDAALNCCNKLPFEQRVAHSFQQALRQELLLKYMNHEAVERSVLAALQPELAEEAVPA